MHDWDSLAHVRWDCKCHVAFISKYRKKNMYASLRKTVREILLNLCRQRGTEIVEGAPKSAHVHMCLRVPPECGIAFTVGFLKVEFSGKSNWMKRQSVRTSGNRTNMNPGKEHWIQVNVYKNRKLPRATRYAGGFSFIMNTFHRFRQQISWIFR